jgi:enterochelin esterase-like enzyme
MRTSRLVVALALVLVVAVPAAAQTEGTLRFLKITSTALQGNLLGDPAEQDVAVYLPPGYDQGERRYPVLYLLHGFAGGIADWTQHWDLKGAMDAVIGSGQTPFLVVMPNGNTRLGGGFYLDSPVSGKWETYLLSELVPVIDRDFRTVSTPASRGIAGHSMGGFGALRLGMRHPEVFGSVYAMSPCCLDVADDIGHGNTAWKKAIGFRSPEDIGKAVQEEDFYPVAIYALAAALSPNPRKPPFFVDLPMRHVRGELMPDDAVYEVWRTSLLHAQLPSHRANLLRLRGIAMDYGTSDQFAHIITTTPQFSRELARLRIPHRLDVYDGDHRQKIPERLKTHVLPFFADLFGR